MNDSMEVSKLGLVCHEVRRRVFSTILNAGSGHLGGSSSSAELMVTLYFGGILRYDPENPAHPHRDRVLVRGHLGPLRYSIFSLLGWIAEEELLTYRSIGSRLQGHEAMEITPGVDITPSGSLGMVLSYGVGAAVALYNQKSKARVYVFLGDGEEQEGNVSEAARHAAHLKLTNLICILDRNTKQLSRPTSTADGAADTRTIWRGYGWHVEEIANGNSVLQDLVTFRNIENLEKPLLIIANTTKGYGISGAKEHFSGYHTLGVCTPELVSKAIENQRQSIQNALKELGGEYTLKQVIEGLITKIPRPPQFRGTTESRDIQLALYPVGTEESVVDAFVTYLQQLTERVSDLEPLRLYVMTADLIQLDQVTLCGLGRPGVNYLDVGIREQHLLALAHGLSVTDKDSRVIINYGDAFLYRGSDQLHVGAQAGSKMVIVGDDGGLSGARNGPTHQSSGQPGILLTMPGLTFLEPADIEDFYNCMNWALSVYPQGPIYIRLHNASIQNIILPPRVQKSLNYYVVHEPDGEVDIVLVGAGLATFGMIEAARRLKDRSIGVRAVNVVNPKALDGRFVGLMGEGVPILTIYNGNAHLLQFAVAKAVMEYNGPRPSRIAGHGFNIGTSGRMGDLLRYFKLDGNGVEEVIRQNFPEVFG